MHKIEYNSHLNHTREEYEFYTNKNYSKINGYNHQLEKKTERIATSSSLYEEENFDNYLSDAFKYAGRMYKNKKKYG